MPAKSNQMFKIFALIALVLCDTGRSSGINADDDARDVQRVVVSEYLQLCPTVSTCTANASLVIDTPRFDGGYGVYYMPCCDWCSCEKDCGDNYNCCPDLPGLKFKLHDESVVKLDECISSNYRRYDTQKITFTMVTKCPLDHDQKEAREQCEMEHTNSSSLTEDASSLVPVNVGNVTYKNKFCALCHGAIDGDLVYWNVTFACVRTPSTLPTTFKEILKTVQTSSDQCDLDYKFPQGVDPIDCEKIIDKCNVSGTWEVYDENLVKACNSYTSTFAQAYRNVHCYLCNGHNVSDVEPLCEYKLPQTGSSFVALLDFNNLEKSEASTVEETTCPQNAVLDPVKGTCLNLTCGIGFVLNNNECKSLYLSLTSGQTRVVYGVRITLAPRKHRSREETLLDDIENMLKETIVNITVNLNLDHCMSYSFVKIKSSIRELIFDLYKSERALLFADIEYIALYVRISESDPDNIINTVRKIEGSINMNSTGFIVNFRSIPLGKFIRATINLDGYKSNRDDIEKDMISSQRLPFVDYMALNCGSDEDGIGLLPLIHDSDMTYWGRQENYEIDFDTSCAKIEISNDTYNISLDETHVYIKGFDMPFERGRTSLSEYDDVVRVCKEDFVNAAKKRSVLDDTENLYSPLTLVTIVCVSFSVLALILTLLIYCVFPVLRTVPGLNNIGLILSLIVTHALTLVNAVVDIATVWVCRFVGIALHFALLSSFSWMFVCTLHMARVFATMTKRSVSETTLKVFVYYIGFAEIISILIVVVTVVVTYLTSDGASIGYAAAPCYVESDTLVYNVAIPAALMIILNFAMFGYVIVTISRLPNMRKSSTHERHNITIFAKLSTLTGLTWIFGFVYQFTDIQVFAYLFTVLNASQGIFIMFSFVINRRVFDMIRKKKEENSSSNSKQVKIISTGQFSSVNNVVANTCN